MSAPTEANGLEVESYRDLIRALIATDEPCPAYSCDVTFLGHLLAGCTPEQVAMVKALDPSQQAKP